MSRRRHSGFVIIARSAIQKKKKTRRVAYATLKPTVFLPTRHVAYATIKPKASFKTFINDLIEYVLKLKEALNLCNVDKAGLREF